MDALNGPESPPCTVVLRPRSSGEGAGILAALAQEATTVVDVLDQEGSEDLQGRLGGSAMVDLREPSQVEALAGLLLEAYAVRNVVLVHALPRPAAFLDCDEHELMSRTEDPARRLLNVVRALAPSVAQARGSLVNVVPIRVGRGVVPTAVDAMARGVLWQLAKGLAVEMAEHDVTANCVITAPLEEGNETPLKRTPMRRSPEPAEIGAAVRFLLSPGARYLTGQFLHLDGGNGVKL